jgi:DnaK suppressor protein
MTVSPFDTAQLHEFEMALGARRQELTAESQRLADGNARVQNSRSEGSADGAHDAAS